MRKVKEQLGTDLCGKLLFLHAVTGYDTTSRLHGVDKAMALKKFENTPYIGEQANVFICRSAMPDIDAAGEKALFSLYGSKRGVGLTALRYQRYFEKFATKTAHIQLQQLPPTASAARYRNLGVYLQVQQWQEEDAEMSFEEWGWKLTGGELFPVSMDLRLPLTRF